MSFVNVAYADFASCAQSVSSSTWSDCADWTEATSTGLLTTSITSLSSALYNVLVIIIPVAVAVGIFFFAYAWVQGVFRNRR